MENKYVDYLYFLRREKHSAEKYAEFQKAVRVLLCSAQHVARGHVEQSEVRERERVYERLQHSLSVEKKDHEEMLLAATRVQEQLLRAHKRFVMDALSLSHAEEDDRMELVSYEFRQFRVILNRMRDNKVSIRFCKRKALREADKTPQTHSLPADSYQSQEKAELIEALDVVNAARFLTLKHRLEQNVNNSRVKIDSGPSRGFDRRNHRMSARAKARPKTWNPYGVLRRNDTRCALRCVFSKSEMRLRRS
ncbi:hypothetical protein DIPPA_59185 [Diplonema papillatum]|nr:hypothetical protein DIPPA_59185 [Diplonema papillatum]